MIITETFERQKLYAFAAIFLASRGAKNVLDIACGDGEGSAILAQRIPSVSGVDISIDLINCANKNSSNSNLSFIAGDARSTGFNDSYFDGVVSCHTLEHFDPPNQVLFLKELKRIAKPGAPVIIATPDKEVWKLQGIAGMQKDHIKELTRSEAEELLRKSGLKIDKVFGQEILKSAGLSFRSFFNFLKRIDVFKLRRLFSDKLIANVDESTQPVALTGEVVPLEGGDRASINIFVCRKA